MSVVVVTNESWLSRLGKSVIGVLFGLILFAGSFVLLFWNEGRAVQTARSLDEGLGAVVSVSPDRVDPASDHKLVHMSGGAKTDETLTDPKFGISANAVKLMRDVEMYQWQEHQSSQTRKKLGGGTETVTVYDYNKIWSPTVINSSSFREGWHNNPTSMRFSSTTLVAQKVTVGAFRLTGEQIEKLGPAEDLNVDSGMIAGREIPVLVESGGLYVHANPSSPDIGDLRIRFRVVRPGPVSLVAMQVGDSFAPYQTRAGDALLLVEDGTKSAAEMFKSAQAQNTVLTWVLRAVGWLVMFIGLVLSSKPLSVLGDVIPFIGSLIGAGLGIFSFFISAALSLVTIAVAWVVYRPLVGIGLLVVAAGAIVLLVTRRKRPPATAAGQGA